MRPAASSSTRTFVWPSVIHVHCPICLHQLIAANHPEKDSHTLGDVSNVADKGGVLFSDAMLIDVQVLCILFVAQISTLTLCCQRRVVWDAIKTIGWNVLSGNAVNIMSYVASKCVRCVTLGLHQHSGCRFRFEYSSRVLSSSDCPMDGLALLTC